MTPTLNQEQSDESSPDHIHLDSDECMHCNVVKDDAGTLEQCPSIKRMKYIFRARKQFKKYRDLCRRKLYDFKSSAKHLLVKNKKLSVMVLNDFLHVKQHMDFSDTIKNKVRNTFRDEFECTNNDYRRNTNYNRQGTITIQHNETEEKYHEAETMTVEDTAFEQQMNGFYSYLTRALSVPDPDANIQQNEPQQSSIQYIGKTEDEKWYKYDEEKEDEAIYDELIKNMGIFRVQHRHGFNPKQYHGLMHLKPRYKNIKEEVFQNPFYSISRDCWNQTMRKSDTFYKSFARRYINTRCDGTYYDQITQNGIQWKRGDIINLEEIVTLKLYTDFDKLQHQLKKCFRFESDSDIFALHDFNPEMDHIINDSNAKDSMFILEQRLSAFYFWRNGLLRVLHKYSYSMNGNKALYHGVNAKMILNNGTRNGIRFCGPLSTSSSYHVARTFATAKGMILKMTTQYPRLNLCRAFDASYISDYPEEQEWLVASVYLRITAVYTKPFIANRCSFDDIDNDINNEYKIPHSSLSRSIFFALHLFRSQLFSMSLHLEYWLTAFIYLQCQYDENDDNCDGGRIKRTKFVDLLQKTVIAKDNDHNNDDLYRFDCIINILWNKFENFRKFPNLNQIVRFDVISDNLKPYLMDFNGFDIRKKEKYIVSFAKIIKIFENITEIHFINNYTLDNMALGQLIQYLHQNKNNKLKKVKFLYYDYELHPTDCTTFFDPNKLNDTLRNKLNKENWTMNHKNIGKTGYGIVLHKR